MPYDPVVEPSALRALPAFRLVDARAADGVLDTVTGAVRAPIEAWEAAAKAGETALSNIAFWQRAIAGLGVVDGDAPCIVFDDGRMTDAARVWFILQYFGAEAFILNGGRPALEGLGELSGRLRAPRLPSTFQARPGSGPIGLVDRAALRAELGDVVRIFDARTADEYRGEDLRDNRRGGHLPGARQLSHASLMRSARLKPPEELRDVLAQAGFRPGDPIVTHCDGGGRAALAAAAAARAGHTGVRAYYLSFADWAKDESCPIEGETRMTEKAKVRYIVDDVAAAVDFYHGLLGFEVDMNAAPGFAMLSKGPLQLLMNAPGAGGAGAAMPDGATPAPGGWNRIQIEVEDLQERVDALKKAGVKFRNEIVQGNGGRQILAEDPSRNLVELFEPRRA